MSEAKRSHPRRNPDLAFRAVGEEGGLVVVPADSRVEVLNPVGSLIFSKLDGEHSRDDIVLAIVGEFEVSESEARADLDEFLSHMESRNMLASPNGVAGGNGAPSAALRAAEEGGGEKHE